MKYETVRIYGKANKIGWWPSEEDTRAMSWKEKARAERECQYEVAYQEATFVDGELQHIQVGTEDFTIARASQEICFRRLCGWYGKYNRGGHKAWEELRWVKVRKGTAPRLIKAWAYATRESVKNGNLAAIELEVR